MNLQLTLMNLQDIMLDVRHLPHTKASIKVADKIPDWRLSGTKIKEKNQSWYGDWEEKKKEWQRQHSRPSKMDEEEIELIGKNGSKTEEEKGSSV